MITYKAIIQYFDSIASQHQQIESFTYGEVNFFDKDKFTEYPALHITPTGTSIDDQVLVYGFDVIVFDRYNVESNKMRNEANCLSDALMILQDICKEITDGKYFINQDTLISMELPVICQPFIDTEPDNCSGWTTSFNVITPNEASACLIPYFNPEKQFAKSYVLPNSAPSQIAWFSREQIHDKASFTNNKLFSLEPVVDTISGDDTLTMNTSSSNVTWNPQKNAIHFFDQSQTTPISLNHPVMSEEFATFFVRIKDFGRYSFEDFGNTICYFGNFLSENDGFFIEVFEDGKLTLFTPAGSPDANTPFSICPTNGNDYSNQHRRQESFTFCLRYDFSESKLKLYYGSGANDNVEINSGFELDNAEFGIGHPRPDKTSDFYLQEYIYTNELMTDKDIANTLIWLNNR